METVTDFTFLSSKITADGDCRHEIKRLLLLGRKVWTNLLSHFSHVRLCHGILKSRDTTLLIKVHIVKAMAFLVVMYGCKSWTIKKATHQRIDAFELWYWRKLLRVPWTARSNQTILKKINPEYSLEDWFWSWRSKTLATWCKEPTHWKRPWCWERLKAREEGVSEDEMVGWQHWLNAHELEQIPGDSEGQGSLICCNSWGCKELTQPSDWTTTTTKT